MDHQKFDDDAGELELNEDYLVLDDATAVSTEVGSNLDLSNLRKRKIKIISSAKETIENGEFFVFKIVRFSILRLTADKIIESSLKFYPLVNSND